MYLIITSIIFAVLCWKFGDWKNWKLYYPTILYLMIGDLTNSFITYNHTLWTYGGWPFNSTFANLYVLVFKYPSIVILYLTFMPKGAKKQIIYMVMCALLFTFNEYLSMLTYTFFHFNGWTVWYSLLFNFIMFPLLWLHYKKPLVVWPISFILVLLLLILFKVPLSDIK